MADVVVHGPVSWNHIVSVDVLPDPSPHLQAATAHHEVLGGTSAGKAAHLRELGVDVELHTVLGTDLAAASVEAALRRANVAYLATRVDGPSERHLNLTDPPVGGSPSTSTPPPPRRGAHQTQRGAW